MTNTPTDDRELFLRFARRTYLLKNREEDVPQDLQELYDFVVGSLACDDAISWDPDRGCVAPLRPFTDSERALLVLAYYASGTCEEYSITYD